MWFSTQDRSSDADPIAWLALEMLQRIQISRNLMWSFCHSRNVGSVKHVRLPPWRYGLSEVSVQCYLKSVDKLLSLFMGQKFKFRPQGSFEFCMGTSCCRLRWRPYVTNGLAEVWHFVTNLLLSNFFFFFFKNSLTVVLFRSWLWYEHFKTVLWFFKIEY